MKIIVNFNYRKIRFVKFCSTLFFYLKTGRGIVNNFLGPRLTNIKKGRFLVLTWSFTTYILFYLIDEAMENVYRGSSDGRMQKNIWCCLQEKNQSYNH